MSTDPKTRAERAKLRERKWRCAQVFRVIQPLQIWAPLVYNEIALKQGRVWGRFLKSGIEVIKPLSINRARLSVCVNC